MPTLFGSNGWTRLRRFVQLAGVAVLAVLVAACGGSSRSADQNTDAKSSGGSPASGQSIDELTVVVPVMSDALDTTKASVGSLGTLLLGLEPLMRYGPDQELTPNLAESFEQDGATTYRLKLRGGVKFWDGSPLTTDDVLASIAVHRTKGTASFIAGQWADVKSVRETAPDELTIRLSRPNPQFVYALAQTGIFSKAFAAKHGDQLGSPRVLTMGTGPYRFESFTPSSKAVLVRNEDYWGERPRVGRIETRVIADDSNRLLALQSGDVDAIIGIPLSQTKTFSRIPDFKVSDTVDYSVYKFNFELDKKGWDDIHLRRAFAHTVDRKALAGGVLGGAAPATTLVPPSIMEGLLPKDEVAAAYEQLGSTLPAFDLKRAKAELAQSRTPKGLKTTLLVAGSDPNLSALAQTVAQNAKKVGIELDIKQVDDNTYFNAVYFKHTTDGLSIDNYGSDGPDPVNIPNNALNSATALPGGSGINIADFRDRGIDELFARGARLEADDPARGPLIIEALKRSAAELPYVPIAYPRLYMGLKKDYAYDGFSTFWWLNRWPDQIAASAS